MNPPSASFTFRLYREPDTSFGVEVEAEDELVTLTPWDESLGSWIPPIEMILDPEGILLQSLPSLEKYHHCVREAVDEAIILCAEDLDLLPVDLAEVHEELLRYCTTWMAEQEHTPADSDEEEGDDPVLPDKPATLPLIILPTPCF